MKLHFVELRVNDWPASLAWYRDVLKLQLLLRDDVHEFALLAAGDVRLALKRGSPTPGGVLLAWQVEQLAPYRHLSSDEKVSAEGYRRLRFRDPDGYDLVLFEQLDVGPRTDGETGYADRAL